MNHFKKNGVSVWLFAIGVGTALVLPFQSFGSGPRNLPEIELRKLGVNTGSSYRTLVFKPESEAIGEIRKLVHLSPVEEAWAFLPEQGAWHEIGFNEQAEHAVGKGQLATTAEIDFDFLGGLEKKNSHVIVYHFHPAGQSSVSYLVNSTATKQGGISSRDLKVMQAIQDQRDSLPSPHDMELMIFETVYFAQLHWHTDMSWKICSALGVTEFKLTEMGLRRFKKLDSAKTTDYVAKLFDAGQKLYLKDRAARIQKGHDFYAPALEARIINEKLNTKEIEVYFTPYSDLKLVKIN